MPAPAVIAGLFSIGSSLIDKLFPDPEAAAAAKLKLFELEQKGELAELAAKSQIITAEAKSEHFIVAAWRPIIMLTFGFIVFNNYVLSPWLAAMGGPVVHLDLPPDMWALLKLGIGGYVVGRSAEKGIKAWKE